MKYRFYTCFWYDEDDAALTKRLLEFFSHPLFQNTVLMPRSKKLSPSRESIAALLAQPDSQHTSDINWVAKRRGKPITGWLSVIRNRGMSPGFTSFLDVKFALTAGYKSGPFQNADEVRDAMWACMLVGPSHIGRVEVEDEPHESKAAKYERFQAIDDMAIPLSIEWVTVLHRDIEKNMQVDLQRLNGIAGVQCGKSGDYSWIVLCQQPFSFVDGTGVAAREAVHEQLKLAKVQERFRRVNV